MTFAEFWKQPTGAYGGRPFPSSGMELESWCKTFFEAGEKEWKKKYQKLNKELMAELRDPSGTIWEHAVNQQKRIVELEKAIIKTLNENGHLADGKNCTLIDLKRAIPAWGGQKS